MHTRTLEICYDCVLCRDTRLHIWSPCNAKKRSKASTRTQRKEKASSCKCLVRIISKHSFCKFTRNLLLGYMSDLSCVSFLFAVGRFVQFILLTCGEVLTNDKSNDGWHGLCAYLISNRLHNYNAGFVVCRHSKILAFLEYLTFQCFITVVVRVAWCCEKCKLISIRFVWPNVCTCLVLVPVLLLNMVGAIVTLSWLSGPGAVWWIRDSVISRLCKHYRCASAETC